MPLLLLSQPRDLSAIEAITSFVLWLQHLRIKSLVILIIIIIVNKI